MKYIIPSVLVLLVLAGCVSPSAKSGSDAYDAHVKAANENARRANEIARKQHQQVLKQQKTFIQQTKARHKSVSPY